MRTDGLKNNYTNVEPNLFQSLLSIRKEPTADNVECILDMPAFSHLLQEIVCTSDTQSKMTVSYLKDVSFLLSLIVAARTSDIDLHLQSERQLLNLIHAFDRIH